MKNVLASLALAGFAFTANVYALSTNDIQLWTGCGTNRAAMVIEWNSPQVFNNSAVPAPLATKTMVWGYKFNGSATGTQMFDAVLAADRRLYAVVDNTYGTFVEGIGYNLSGDGNYGVTDETNTYTAGAFVNGNLLNSYVDVDAATPLNSGDLFWSGYFGPNWNVWNELNQTGGFASAPNRGANPYASWDPDAYTWTQGQWESSYAGLDGLNLQDGSWIGFSVGAAGYDANAADAATTAYLQNEQAPPSPDGTYVAYICNTNDFATQIVSTNNLYPSSPYNDPAAILGRPTLDFLDEGAEERTKIVEDPYNTAPDGSDIITEIKTGGQITVAMGRKVYHNPNNPYGFDFMVYGNSFFQGGFVDDESDLDSYSLSPIAGHSTAVAVSQDGTNWYTFAAESSLFPDNAYFWDEANHSWTDQQMNPTKPLNPFIYTNNFTGQSCASALDTFIGAAGGTGYNLQASGLPWIQYIRVQPGPGAYTVIDSIAAVNPAVVGDALSIAPDNLAAGITNLSFQSPADSCRNLISIHFHSVNEQAKVSTVALSEFSAFAPVPGCVASACQITVAAGASYLADLSLNAGPHYTGDGSDLRVLQWNGTNWDLPPFVFNPANGSVCLTGLTNLSAFVVTQLAAPLAVHAGAGKISLRFTPFANMTYVLERSTNLILWCPVVTNTPADMQPITLQDPVSLAGHAFYRLKLTP